MKLIDGKKHARLVYASLAPRISALRKKGITPKIVTVLVGNDPASEKYVQKKLEAAEMLGFIAEKIHLKSSEVNTESLVKLVEKICKQKNTHGILVQLPLPKKVDVPEVIKAIDPMKDVDGFQAYNLGKLVSGFEDLPSATPAGIIDMLSQMKVNLVGKNVVVVGASLIVGRPLAFMLLNRGATVTVCNKSTKNLEKITSMADIVVSATGVAHLIKAKHIKKGSILIDVGFSRDKNGKFVGDIDPKSVQKKAKMLTPVPGGVGPMTIASLMKNLVHAAERQSGINEKSVQVWR